MGSTTLEARHGEDTYPIGRFILGRTRALGNKVEWHPGSVCRFHRSGMSG